MLLPNLKMRRRTHHFQTTDVFQRYCVAIKDDAAAKIVAAPIHCSLLLDFTKESYRPNIAGYVILNARYWALSM